MNTDKVELELVFEKLISKDVKEENTIEHIQDIVIKIKNILMTGPTWEFNPTCGKIFEEAFKINDAKLLTFIEEEGYTEIEPLDVNNNFVKVTVPVELLLANVKHIPDDLLLKSEAFLITTIFGEITL